MRILAIDTSAVTATVAVTDNEKVLGEISNEEEIAEIMKDYKR